MEEKKQAEPELCVITREFAQKQLDGILNTPAKKEILENYFMWINVLKSSANLVNEPETVSEETV